MKTSHLDFVVLNGKNSEPLTSAVTSDAFMLWSRVWSQALKELDGSETIRSDDFTRHDQIGLLRADKRPIASVSFTVADLGSAVWRADSYFKVWPEKLLRGLGESYPGPKVMIGCYFTVDPEWRRDAQGFSAKRLMMALTVEHFLASRCEVMVGTMRMNRGMHSLSYESGATSLLKDVIHHGVAVDLLIWDKQTILSADAPYPYRDEAIEIYNRGIDLTKVGGSRLRTERNTTAQPQPHIRLQAG